MAYCASTANATTLPAHGKFEQLHEPFSYEQYQNQEQQNYRQLEIKTLPIHNKKQQTLSVGTNKLFEIKQATKPND